MLLSLGSEQLGSAVSDGERRLLAAHGAETKRWASTQLSREQLFPPLSSGKIKERGQKEGKSRRWAGLSSERDPATDIMNSQPLWCLSWAAQGWTCQQCITEWGGA